MTQLTVAELAEQAAVSPHTVRYYDRVGILPTPGRSPAGYRLYEQTAVERLRFIRGAQSVGLRLREVRNLLEIMDRGQCPCGHTEQLVRQHLTELDTEIRRLRNLKTELAGLLDKAQSCPPDSWWCATEFTRKEANNNGTKPMS
jgi:DNA-binding transcriptional MerR regulator